MSATEIYSHHLQRHLITLQEQPELASTLYAVISATEPIQLDRILSYKLSSLGLIVQLGHKTVPTCKLYRYFFENQQRR